MSSCLVILFCQTHSELRTISDLAHNLTLAASLLPGIINSICFAFFYKVSTLLCTTCSSRIEQLYRLIVLSSLLLLFSHSVISESIVTPWTIAHQALSMEILQERILEWVPVPSCRGSSQLRGQTQVSCIVSRFFTI